MWATFRCFSRNNPCRVPSAGSPSTIGIVSPVEVLSVADEHAEVEAHLLEMAEAMREDLGDYDRVGRNMRFFDPFEGRPTRPPVPPRR